jgi:thioredoxin reductase/NAD-dependent dihydropyrimidine dehydrogenase PreA subunit
MSTILIVAAALALALLAVAAWRALERRNESVVRRNLEDLSAMGDVVAAGRHPKIDPDRCIGSGGCVAACPEKGVLAVVDGRGVLANPLACVGHGLCAEACPVEAITLVYGSATRAVELPRIDERYETNQPGVFIVGELGGMGLIRNAVHQGKQAAQHIAESTRRGGGDVHDAIVVGAGPAGISAALGLKEAGLDALLVDREELGGTILHYPRAKVVMTGTLDLPLYGKVRASTMSKEQLVSLWRDIDEKVGLPFRGGTLVQDLERDGEVWAVHSPGGVLRGANVVLALGRRGSPRKLGVPGEDHPKVAYRLLEPEEFRGKHTVVVGGGNSAVESAIALAESGGCASVGLSYRRSELARCRGDNRRRIGELMDAGRIDPLFKTNVVAIDAESVRIRHDDGREEVRPNDALIIQIGGTPPSKLLGKFGIEMVEKRGDE